MRGNLLGTVNAKTSKGEPLGYITGILYLVPSDGSGLGNLCPNASTGCRAACLFSAGRGRMQNVKAGRMRKTRLFFENSAKFVDMLSDDIHKLVRECLREDKLPCVRLNGTSDIPWEWIKGTDGLTIFQKWPNVQFYDYTKRFLRFDRPLPGNYHLTFSRSEANEYTAESCYGKHNVAVVFNTKKGHELPMWWKGVPVIDADQHDLRFLDPQGVICGLRAKGKAKKDKSGFVVDTTIGE